MKLNQVIAIANGEKSRKEKVLSKIYQKLQKHELFMGITRKYQPLEESAEGSVEKLPEERKLVQLTVESAISEAIVVLKDTINIIATQDIGNQTAKANVVIDGDTILKDVPATHLIYLEKQLIDIHTFVSKFPILDPSEKWEYSPDSSCYKSEVRETARTKRIQKPIVKYAATEHHPAQTELITEDKIVGNWETIFLSGAIKKEDKDKFLHRILEFSKAVKIAREAANCADVTMSTIGDDVLDYIFGE
jgi:hypothetical protein